MHPSGNILNFSLRSSGANMALNIIVAQAVDAISEILPRVRATKVIMKNKLVNIWNIRTYLNSKWGYKQVTEVQ